MFRLLASIIQPFAVCLMNHIVNMRTMHHQLLATNWSTFFCFLHILVKKSKQRLASNKSSPVLFSFFVFFYGVSELHALLWRIWVSIFLFFHVVLFIWILEIGDSPSDQSTSEGNQFESLQNHCIMFEKHLGIYILISTVFTLLHNLDDGLWCARNTREIQFQAEVSAHTPHTRTRPSLERSPRCNNVVKLTRKVIAYDEDRRVS